MKKFVIFLKVYWVQIIIISFSIVLLGTILFLLVTGFNTFATMESFSRKQLTALMGIYLIIGILQAFIFVGLMQLAQYHMMSGNFLINRDKITTARTNVKWTDVIGMDSAKQEAGELVKLLKDRALLKRIGGRIIKGTMMIGPPGCGKTYLAKAIATECGLPFLPAVGSDFVGIFVGQGAAQMRSLFKRARALAALEGGCIIFIDEIDSFARPRMADTGFGGGISHNATINQFLTEMDGLRQIENNIVVIAATNVDESDLDPAIMRAGRFDRKIYVTRPNLKEREQIFAFYLKKVAADASVRPDILARKTLWFSPSDIENMIRESSLIALRENREAISFKDLSMAYDRVVFGAKSNLVLSEKDKEWVAYHESGHAIIGYLLHPTDDVIKATIIPHRGALGFVAPQAKEEIYIHNREQYMATIKVNLAAYAAEQIKYGTTGSGVSSDFSSAINLAYRMVWHWGMGKSGYLGNMEEVRSHLGQSYISENYISEKTREKLDQDVQEILQTCLNEAKEVLLKHRDLLDYFAQELLRKSELEYDEIEAIFNKFNLKPISGRSTITEFS